MIHACPSCWRSPANPIKRQSSWLRGDRPQRELRVREPPGGPRRSRQWPRARLLEEPVQAPPTGAGCWARVGPGSRPSAGVWGAVSPGQDCSPGGAVSVCLPTFLGHHTRHRGPGDWLASSPFPSGSGRLSRTLGPPLNAADCQARTAKPEPGDFQVR